jgi:hypothetical protein
LSLFIFADSQGFWRVSMLAKSGYSALVAGTERLFNQNRHFSGRCSAPA